MKQSPLASPPTDGQCATTATDQCATSPADGQCAASAAGQCASLGANLLAADDLFGCDHRFLLNRLTSTTALLPKPVTPIGVQRREEASRTRMNSIYTRMVTEFGATRIPSDTALAWEATQRAIAAGAPLICGAYLPGDAAAGRAGAACILMRAADGRYTPVITVNHKTYDVREATAPHPPHTPVEHLSRPSLIPHASDLAGWDPRPHPELKLRHHTRDQLRLTHLWLLMQTHHIPATGQGGVIDVRGQLAIVHWLEESLRNYTTQFASRKRLVQELTTALASTTVGAASGARTAATVSDAKHTDTVATTGAPTDARAEHAAPTPAAATSSRQAILRQLPTRARRRSECHDCGWWDTLCQHDLTLRGDVSLVVSADQAKALARENIHTIAQLASPDVGEPEGWSGNSFQTVVALARASLDGYEIVRKDGAVPVPRADVEIDIDMESMLDDGAYLWGALLSYTSAAAEQAMTAEEGLTPEQSAAPGYRPYVTWRKLPHHSTADCFVRLWQWLSQIRHRAAAKGLTCMVYCYAQTGERHWMLTNVQKESSYPGMPSEREVRELLDGPHWVDMFQLVERQFVGVHGLGLKKVAPVAGFQWRDEEPSGEASIAWHAQAVLPETEQGSTTQRSGEIPPESGAPTAQRDSAQHSSAAQARSRILAYNEDDVRATLAVRNWLSSGEWVSELPALSELARPQQTHSRPEHMGAPPRR